MKRIIKRDRKKQYMGLNTDQLRDVLFILNDLVTDVGMTDAEQDAMDVAIQAVTDIRNDLIGGGKVRKEWR